MGNEIEMAPIIGQSNPTMYARRYWGAAIDADLSDST
jgi:hypothetical protein